MTIPRTFNLRAAPEQVDGLSEALANLPAGPEAIDETVTVEENSLSVGQMSPSDQFSVIGMMAASIVHDFKAPLTVIRGCAELLAGPEINDEKRKRYSDMILEDVDRFLTMSRDLLDYCRGAVNLDPRPIQLSDWLDNLTESIREATRTANISLITVFDFSGEVWMDETRIRRALMNLVTNAIDAMPDGGSLAIVSEMAEGKWRLSVSDTGRGIPVNLRSRIFEPFVTQGKEYGTGLGLATSREIIEGHGGGLNFETRTSDESNGTGPGTTFVIELPLSGTRVPARK